MEITKSYTQQEEISMDIICAATGRKLTDEQKVFASDFTKPTISFSDAGTGKTYATAVGIVHTQQYHKVQGKKMCILSFTREAARSIKMRYDAMSKYSGIYDTANFSTFHSLCFSILTDAYGKIFPESGHVYQRDVPVLKDICIKHGLTEITDQAVRGVLRAIDSMNNNFIFDKNNLSQMLVFKELKMDETVFNDIRVDWFVSQVISRQIPQGDIPIHCYYLLQRNERIREKYHKMFDILIVDEFQDMSVLYLKILFEFAKSLVVIGDMKQQIYAFNGASDQIVEEFMKMFPDARVCPLTHSFRCKDEIIETAMRYELPNKPPVTKGTGTGTGGAVKVKSDKVFNFDEVIDRIYNMQKNRETVEQKDIMFLARNNFSVMTIIEKLYQKDVDFRTTKFKRVMDLPIFSEMCILVNAIRADKDEDKVIEALKLFSEFRWKQRPDQIGPVMAMRKTGAGWLDINYRYRDAYMVKLITLFKDVKEKVEQGISCSRIFKTLLPVYENFIIENNWWKLEFEKEFYINLVEPIIRDKSYAQMYAEENDKWNRNQQNMAVYTGVRCYTIHSAKGLEADEVYILDCDKGVVPSAKNYKKYKNKKCYYEAAKMIRNERNLLYVGVTRAKSLCVLLFHDEVSELISSPESNEYSYLDELYWGNHQEYYNDETFMALFNYTEGDEDSV